MVGECLISYQRVHALLGFEKIVNLIDTLRQLTFMRSSSISVAAAP